MTLTSSHKSEFWFHVSNQNEIPIFGTVEKSIDIPQLLQIIKDLPENEYEQPEFIRSIIRSDSEAIDILRAFVGVSDKRMYLELSYIFGKTKFPEEEVNILGYSIYNLEKHNLKFFKTITKLIVKSTKNEKLLNKIAQQNKLAEEAIKIVTKYLVDKNIISILVALRKLDEAEITAVIKNLVLPKEIQQAETKRRGHGAEWQLAKLLSDLGLSFLPDDKHLSPMSSDDPNVDKSTFLISNRSEEKTWSFDMIIRDSDDNYKAFIQGLIHTSDPGQYGVNKSADTVLIKESLTAHNQSNDTDKELWGLVDGVGFIENPDNTVFKMLNVFDTFIQMKSLYKAGLRAHKLGLVKIKGIKFDREFYNETEANEMFDKYGSKDILNMEFDNVILGTREIVAGKAKLYV